MTVVYAGFGAVRAIVVPVDGEPAAQSYTTAGDPTPHVFKFEDVSSQAIKKVGLTVTGGKLWTRPDIAGFEVRGSATTGSALVAYPVIRSNQKNLYVTGSFDGVDSDNALFGRRLSREQTRVLGAAASYVQQSPKQVVSVYGAVSQGLDPYAPLLDEPLKPTSPTKPAVAGIVDIDTGETLSPLAAFLSHAALEAGDNKPQAGQDAVQLMTVHASKGLEFDCVFIGGMEEGLFPHENSASDRDGLEEERRLMYVAITRARKRLYLSHSQTRLLHGQTRYNIKSRFFDELPEGALKWITPKQQGFGSYSPGFATNSGAAGAYPSSARGQFGLKSETFASPPVPPQKAPPSHGLRVGIAVFHTKFGEGKVLAIEGTGDDARAQVNFPRHGTKWLALSVAKLTVVD